QRAVALAVDPGVVDEEVLVTVVRGDEPEPLVVAEPLYGAGRHVRTPPRYVRAARGGCCSELRPASACTAFAGFFIRPDPPTVPCHRARVLHRCCAVAGTICEHPAGEAG